MVGVFGFFLHVIFSRTDGYFGCDIGIIPLDLLRTGLP